MMRALFVLMLLGSGCVERALSASGSASLSDGGFSQDLGRSDGGGPLDLGRPFDQGMPGLSCTAVVDCLQNCNSDQCARACILKGSSSAQAQINAIFTCLATTCQDLCNADPGDGCDQCQSDVQSPAGTCQGRLACGACFSTFDACM